jgi:hypothetical protein
MYLLSVFTFYFLFINSFLALLYYRKRRAELVKDVADRQRSQINRTDIKFQERIGRGASGEVFKALFRGTEVKRERRERRKEGERRKI